MYEILRKQEKVVTKGPIIYQVMQPVLISHQNL